MSLVRYLPIMIACIIYHPNHAVSSTTLKNLTILAANICNSMLIKNSSGPYKSRQANMGVMTANMSIHAGALALNLAIYYHVFKQMKNEYYRTQEIVAIEK